MPRPPKVWYVKEGGYWLSTSIGERSDKTGRRLGKRNLDIGPPTGRDGARNRAAAELWLNEQLRAEAEAERDRCESDPTFARLAEMYLAWCKGRGLEARTLKGYAERLRAFAAFRHQGVCYGDRLARDFRPADLRRVVAKLKADACASTWVRDVAAAARAAMKWAAAPIDDRVPERLLPANPFADVEGVKVEAPPKRYAGPLARREFFDFLIVRACRLPARFKDWRWERLTIALFRFCEATGCRPSEARRLEWGHIDWESGVATLKGKTTAATGKKRRVPIPTDTLRILRAIERLPDRHERFVFTHERRRKGGGEAGQTLEGDPWTEDGLKQKFGRLRDEAIAAGLAIASEGAGSLTLYQLRRDLGADILRLTGSYAESAEVLGHSVAMNSRHYSSFEDERAVRRANEVAAHRKGKG
jgi:integrase